MAENKDCDCLTQDSQIDSIIEDEVQLEASLENVVEISKAYNGGETKDAVVNVDNEKNIITTTLQKMWFSSFQEFPEVGSDNLIYADKGTGVLYTYNSETNSYDELISEPQITVDTEMSDTSENAVQNKVIKSYVDTEVNTINGDIDSLGNTVTDVENKINGINTSITTINGNISTIEGEIGQINTEITGIKGDLNGVALKSDLDNYIPTQSENETHYSQANNQNGQFSVHISKNGETTDINNLIINKDGVFITGKVKLQGDADISGVVTVKETETLKVKDNIVITNADGVDLVDMSGFGIRKNSSDTYGIVYDPASDSVKLGLGKLDNSGKFTFNEGEGQPVAVRDDSSLFVDGHLVKWDATNHKFVDCGKDVSDSATANSIASRTADGALKATPIADIDIENQTDNTVATKKDIKDDVKTTDLKNLSLNTTADGYWSYDSNTSKIKENGGSRTYTYNTQKETEVPSFSYLARATDIEAITNAHNNLADKVALKQDALTAGSNITITDNTISAKDTTYTAGENITISDDNVISAAGGTSIDIVQETGTSTTDVMSQDATTKELYKKVDKISNSASYSDTWSPKTWEGYSNPYIDGIWADGENIYYSYLSNQYVLNRATSTWEPKVWGGLTRFTGRNIWKDGNEIYYSKNTEQYVLDKATSTWSPKTWGGLTNFSGDRIWNDGENIYYSQEYAQYVLDKATSTWSPKTWNVTPFHSVVVWTDGNEIYFSGGTDQYVLNKETSTWEPKTWSGLTSFNGDDIWTDGENIYMSHVEDQYVLDKATSTWSAKTWSNTPTNFSGSYVWSDGENIYHSYGPGGQNVLDKAIFTSTINNSGKSISLSVSDGSTTSEFKVSPDKVTVNDKEVATVDALANKQDKLTNSEFKQLDLDTPVDIWQATKADGGVGLISQDSDTSLSVMNGLISAVTGNGETGFTADKASGSSFLLGGGSSLAIAKNSIKFDDKNVLTENSIVQSTGTATDKVMSQKTITDELDKKANKPVDETFNITQEAWVALNGNAPYTFMTSVTATKTIGEDTEVGIINDQPTLFANYGFVVGLLDGQTIGIFSIGQPTASVNLTVRFKE